MAPRTLAPLLVPAALLLLAPPPRCQAPEQEHDEEHRGLTMRPERDDEADAGWVRALLDGVDGLGGGLEELGATLSVGVIADSSQLVSGGLDRGRTDRALVDVALEVDLDRAAGLDDTAFFAEFYSLSGRDASEDVGDIQAFSNIDGENVAQLAELWLERRFAGGALRLKAGKADANSEFAHVNAGLGFLHSSAGYSPTIFPFPTYPDPAVGVNAFARPAPGWRVGLGVYNAQDGGAVSGRRGLSADFDEAFLVGQLGRAWGEGAGRLALGAWHHTGDFARFDGGTDEGASGTYALLEQRLLRERGGGDQGLVGFLQWGAADGDVSEFERHLGAGLLYTGLLPGLDAWETGLYLSHADLTSAPGAGLGGSELAVELYQEVRLGPSLVLKPDLQYVADPSGSDAIDDAWVASLRVELSL